MSYLTSALKQSQQSMTAEQDYLTQRQHAQLNRYKKIATITATVVLSAATFASGYYIGKLTQPTAAEITKQQPTAKVAPQSQPEKQPQPSEPQLAAEPQATQPAATAIAPDPAASAAPQPSQQSSASQQHFQWVSVQVGVDNQGQPLYQQQLVPVDALTQAPVVSNTPQAKSAPAATEVSVGEQGDGDYSGYRVLGAPLQQPTQELEGVSDELKEAFANAVKETEQKQSVDVISASKTSAAATPVELLPSSLQASIPSLRYQAHIYATEASKRWIKINNRPLYEGDSLGALTVVEITPEQTRFDFDGIEFSLQAMQDWLP